MPTAESGRLQTLDILRGFALFGMILVHFHQKMRVDVTGPEDLVAWGVWVLVEQKAWGTFAFLFGAGFAILLRGLDARGAKVVPIYLRRLAVLAGLGVVAEVGFGFDVLFTYACWGLVLLALRRWSTRALLIAALLAAVARPCAAELTALYAWSTGTAVAPSKAALLERAVDAAAERDSYSGLLAARWRLFLGTTPGGWRGVIPDVNLALFILGLLAVRHRIVDRPLEHAALIRRWVVYGAASWLTYWLVLRRLEDVPVPAGGWPLAQGLGLVQDRWLCLAYIGAALLFLASRPAWTERLASIGGAGRLALTNYMIQIVVLDVLASGYGLHVRLRPIQYVLAATALFASEALLSRAWLRRFRFGPLEWLWRTATYAEWQPFRQALRRPAFGAPIA